MALPRITDSNRSWWTLAGACMGLFMLMLDSTVVTLALPDVQRDLHASSSELQWVLNAYLLALAVLVVTAGRLGDVYGRRRLFLLGLLIFTGGLVLAATAGGMEVLILARVIQGVGGAAMLTLSLAIVSEAFGDEQRSRALGIWAGVSALALSLGPILGGLLVDGLSWRWVFWIGVPPLLAGWLITSRAARETRDEQADPHVDVPGLTALTVGLTGVVLALVQGAQWGWDAPETLVVGVAGIAGLVAFALFEPRVRAPIVEFALFRNRPYLGASAAAFCLVGAWWGVIFYFPQYLQEILGYSAVASGALVLPITAPMVIISPLAPRLIARVGVRALMTLGMACGTVGTLLLTRIDATSGYATLLPGFLLFGIALGLVYAPMSTAAMAAMPHAKAGIAAGVLAMNRMVAGAFVLAGMGALFEHLRDDERVGESLRAADSYALAHSLWLIVGLCAIGTALTWWLVRSPERVEAVAVRPSSSHGHHGHHF
ncbi:MAG TPA: MFS transporter [Conexibacter sp.]|jgi:EmrB/QacA subfamily drug resistance transporter|nr:MFS transporter [Conexibacter sp.]